MNIHEKKKIDKIIQADIDNALGNFNCKRSDQQDELEKKLMSTGEIGKLVKRWKELTTERDGIDKKLEHLGFDTNGDGTVDANNYGVTHPEIIKFQKETNEKRDKINNVSREFTVRLYADNEEAQTLLVDLAKVLEKLI